MPTAPVPKTVLVIDDDPLTLRMLEHFLKGKGFDAESADSGIKGLSQFRQHQDRIAAVICDVQMPDMTGFEVLHQILALAPDIKMIMVSGDDAPETKRALLAAGALALIPKPVSFTRLYDLLKA